MRLYLQNFTVRIMSKIFDGGPAFPRKRKFHYEADTKPGSGMIHDPPQSGMSVRVWLAGMALAGRGKEWGEQGFGGDKVAEYCLQQADFILKRIQEGK
jgi:hypothetical protein